MGNEAITNEGTLGDVADSSIVATRNVEYSDRLEISVPLAMKVTIG